ncbi:MAG: Ig-like domain-containing protein, partial [Marinoscillum sp.]
ADFVIYTSIGVALERDPLGSFRIYKAAGDELVKTIEYDGVNERDLNYGDDENFIKFEFDDDELEPGIEYYVLIDDGFIVSYDEGLYHVGISDPNTWRFTTLAAPTTPTLVSVAPTSNATDIDVATNIVLTYSENVQAYEYGEGGNATNNIILYDANDNVIESFATNSDRLIYSGSKVTINPTNNLSYNTDYYVLIGNEAFESNNEVVTEAITDSGIISFTTEAMPNTAPTATSVGIAGNLESNQELTGSYTYADADTDVESGTTFQWYVADDASGANLTPISGAAASAFTLTASEVGKYITLGVKPNDGTTAGMEVFAGYEGPVVAAIVPTIVSTTPTDGAIDVEVNPMLTLHLSEPITLGDGSITITGSNGESYSFPSNSSNNVSVSDSTITIADIGTPFPLANEVFFTVTFDATAFIDADGNSSTGLTNQTTWNFTTIEANVAPVAEGVSIKKSLVVDGELEGSYTFSDINGDAESGTTFQWYRADDGSGTNKAIISGATTENYTVINDDNGKYVSFGVTPSDGELIGAAVESASFGPVVIDDGITNVPPAFTSDAITRVLDNDTYSYIVTFEDLNDDVPVLTKSTGPDWLSVNGLALTGSPTDANVGEHSVILTLDDQNGGIVNQEFTITVMASNTAPSANSVTAEIVFSLQIGDQISGTYNFIDAESDPDNSTYKWYRADDVSGANKAVISGATAKTYILSTADAGKYISFELTPNDGKVDGTLIESAAIGPVTKKMPSLSQSTIYKTYGDADFDLISSTNSNGVITYSFENDQTGAAINGSTVTLGNAGEITVNVILAEDTEYQARQVQGTIVIEEKAVEVTATNSVKTVGDSDPALQFTVTSGAIVGSDEVVIVSRDAGEAPGTYVIGLIEGDDAGNYEITTNPGVFTISKLPITITADAATKTYGDADPLFSYSITSGA